MIRPLFGQSVSLVTTNEISASATGFEVYPVPSTDTIHFVFSKPYSSPLNYQLTDIAGRIVMSGPLISDKEELNVSHLKAGIYFVRLSSKDYSFNSPARKIVVYH